MKLADKRTEADLREALRRRFCMPQWAFFSGVRNAAGFDANRTADGIAMSLWPSRGLEVYGFEIKVSRGDWLSELRNPAKAEDFFNYCDRWFLVAASRDLVKDGELPPTWGLMVPRGADGLEFVKEAPKNEAATLDRTFVAVLLRRILEQEPDKVAIKAAVEAESNRLTGLFECETKDFKEERDREHKELDLLKDALGSRYNDAASLAAAVRLVLNGGHKHIAERFKHMAREARDLADAAERTAATMTEK